MNECIIEWMNELLNEWIIELLNEWMNEWVNEFVTDWMNHWTIEWTIELLNEWLNEPLIEWINHWLIDWLALSLSCGEDDWRLNGTWQFLVGSGGNGVASDFAQRSDGKGAQKGGHRGELDLCGYFLRCDGGVYSCFFYLFNRKAEAAVCLVWCVCSIHTFISFGLDL